MASIKPQYYVLRTWSMSLKHFWTSIPHRGCAYSELCRNKESRYVKQSTTSKNNIVIWKILCKMFWMNFSKHVQEVRGFEEKMCYEQIFGVDSPKKKTFWSCVKLRKLKQSNIVSPPTNKSAIWSFYTKDTDKYIQEDYHNYISQVYISHMDCGRHMGGGGVIY